MILLLFMLNFDNNSFNLGYLAKELITSIVYLTLLLADPSSVPILIIIASFKNSDDIY